MMQRRRLTDTASGRQEILRSPANRKEAMPYALLKRCRQVLKQGGFDSDWHVRPPPKPPPFGARFHDLTFPGAHRTTREEKLMLWSPDDLPHFGKNRGRDPQESAQSKRNARSLAASLRTHRLDSSSSPLVGMESIVWSAGRELTSSMSANAYESGMLVRSAVAEAEETIGTSPPRDWTSTPHLEKLRAHLGDLDHGLASVSAPRLQVRGDHATTVVHMGCIDPLFISVGQPTPEGEYTLSPEALASATSSRTTSPLAVARARTPQAEEASRRQAAAASVPLRRRAGRRYVRAAVSSDDVAAAARPLAASPAAAERTLERPAGSDVVIARSPSPDTSSVTGSRGSPSPLPDLCATSLPLLQLQQQQQQQHRPSAAMIRDPSAGQEVMDMQQEAVVSVSLNLPSGRTFSSLRQAFELVESLQAAAPATTAAQGGLDPLITGSFPAQLSVGQMSTGVDENSIWGQMASMVSSSVPAVHALRTSVSDVEEHHSSSESSSHAPGDQARSSREVGGAQQDPSLQKLQKEQILEGGSENSLPSVELEPDDLPHVVDSGGRGHVMGGAEGGSAAAAGGGGRPSRIYSSLPVGFVKPWHPALASAIPRRGGPPTRHAVQLHESRVLMVNGIDHFLRKPA